MRRQVMCGDVQIGGGAPVSIQSMTNVDPRDERGLLEQIAALTDAGCQIVRLAIPDREAAAVLGRIKKKTRVPLVADIHFDYRLAIAAMEAGADKIRINPGNIGDPERVRQVVRVAREREIPIRVGVNAGSLERTLVAQYGGVTAEALAESALRSAAQIVDMGYDRLVLSLKASDVRLNDAAHRLVAAKTDFPIHIGVTEAGTLRRGRMKSAIGIGALLLAGIGDTMRVSLTADPVEEVRCAREILETVGLRKAPFEMVSCPTCGRTRIDLPGLAARVEARLRRETLPPGLKIAVMGCAVNGPGEAREADFGVAGGDGKGVLFAGGRIVKTVPEADIEEALLQMIQSEVPRGTTE